MRQVTRTKCYIDKKEREAITKYLTANGNTLSEAARALGVSKGHLSNVLAGKKALTDVLRQRFLDTLGIRIIS